VIAAGGTAAVPPQPRAAVSARAAGIVDGATGAPRPLDQRIVLAAARKVRTVVASCVDGEPGVATRRRVAAARTDELVRGLAAVVAATGAERAVVAIERRAREIGRFVDASAPVKVVVVDDVARCDEPADLAYDVARARVPAGDDPIDHGVLIIDATSLVDLDAAQGNPVTSRAVSIAGAVAHPAVRLFPIGTTVEDAVSAAGGATCGPAWIALGDGPMTGRPLDRDDVITKATRALFVVAAGSDLARRARTPLGDHVRRALSACERCSMCADVCPPRLLGGRLRPDELTRAMGRAGVGWLELAAAVECTACGLCDVACPSGLSPSSLVTSIARAIDDRSRADVARAGHRPHAMRDARRLSLDLVARRLGLGDRAPVPPWLPGVVAVDSVSIPFKQSLGVAARPCVRRGDRVRAGDPIARVPDDALGVTQHASIAGVVSEIDAGAITIRRV
jgi:Na+-translocating ferredoxin:NAD+ oxidoreductase RnfC subunit